MTDRAILVVAVVALYSTGHWIGATVLLGYLAFGLWDRSGWDYGRGGRNV